MVDRPLQVLDVTPEDPLGRVHLLLPAHGAELVHLGQDVLRPLGRRELVEACGQVEEVIGGQRQEHLDAFDFGVVLFRLAVEVDPDRVVGGKRRRGADLLGILERRPKADLAAR